MLKASIAPLNDIFGFMAFYMKQIIQTLDVPIYQGFTYLRLVIGFICLSAIITVFWKGIRG